MNRCPHPNCFADDNTTCTLGHIRLEMCPEWKRVSKGEVAASTDSDQMLLPWSGLAMGESDLNFVSGKVKPITVGIVGPESAGKTTILGAFYLLLGRGALTTDANPFSNSYTLAGWEAVATNLRWKPGQLPASFPPHTPSGAARAPGMLHLGFRREDGVAARPSFLPMHPESGFRSGRSTSRQPTRKGPVGLPGTQTSRC
jgi:hypothetical protein